MTVRKGRERLSGSHSGIAIPFPHFLGYEIRNGNAQRRVPMSFSNLYVLEKVLWNSVSFFFWKSTPPSILN